MTRTLVSKDLSSQPKYTSQHELHPRESSASTLRTAQCNMNGDIILRIHSVVNTAEDNITSTNCIHPPYLQSASTSPPATPLSPPQFHFKIINPSSASLIPSSSNDLQNVYKLPRLGYHASKSVLHWCGNAISPSSAY